MSSWLSQKLLASCTFNIIFNKDYQHNSVTETQVMVVKKQKNTKTFNPLMLSFRGSFLSQKLNVSLQIYIQTLKIFQQGLPFILPPKYGFD